MGTPTMLPTELGNDDLIATLSKPVQTAWKSKNAIFHDVLAGPNGEHGLNVLAIAVKPVLKLVPVPALVVPLLVPNIVLATVTQSFLTSLELELTLELTDVAGEETVMESMDKTSEIGTTMSQKNSIPTAMLVISN